MNSKTTWFSKLFRGDAPATFRVVPEDGDEDSDFGPERDPVAHPASARTLNDPVVQNLIDRIKPRQDMKPPVRPPRPLSFTELAASLPPTSASPQPAAPPSFDPEAFASPAAPEAAEESSTWPFSDRQPIFRKRQPEAAAEPAIAWEPEWKPEPISWNTHAWPVPKPAPIAAAPAPEIAFVPEPEMEPEPQPSAFASPGALYARTSEPPALFPEEKPAPEPETVRNALGKLGPVFTPRPSPSQRFAALERSQAIPDPFSDPEPSSRAYRLEPPPQPKLPVPNAPILSGVEAAESSPEACAATEPPAPAPEAPKLVPAGTAFPPDREAQSRFLNLGRRSTDKLGPDGQPVVPPFTRRWALLSQFEPDLSDPQPAPRRRSTDIKPRPSDPIPSDRSPREQG